MAQRIFEQKMINPEEDESLCSPRRVLDRSRVRSRKPWPASFIMKQFLSAHNLLLLALTFSMLIGCGGGGSDSPAPVTPSADSFKFIVITDVHVRLPGNPDDIVYDNTGNLNQFSGALDRIAASHPDADLVIVNGDLVGCLYSNNPEDYLIGTDNPAETFKAMMETLGKPY